MAHSLRRLLVSAALLSCALPVAAQTAADYTGAQALGLALRRLGTTGRVLMIGAHPDDEDTQLLATLALREGADVAYLSLTRGEGGQNGIGSELGEALGLLRTEELLAARRLDGARQFFGREYDFGFSKTADETFRHWPREEVLRDVVYVIRRFRPDVIIPVFSGTPRDGHGHHQVSGIIAREAFQAAADPSRFPDQIAAGLRPHQAAKLYMSQRTFAEGATLRLAAGDLDPLLGRSAFQQAAAGRSRHRSQDMGRAEPAGPRNVYLRREVPAAAGPEQSIWDGIQAAIDYAAAARGTNGRRSYADEIGAIRQGFNALDPGGLVEPLAAALRGFPSASRCADACDPASASLKLTAERADLQTALALSAGLVLDAISDDAQLVRGQSFMLEVSLWNGGRQSVEIDALEPSLPAGWSAVRADSSTVTRLAAGEMAVRRFRVTVPASASLTEPYFLRAHRDGDLYRWQMRDGEQSASEPFEPAPVRAAARVRLAGVELPMEREATFRDIDLRQGELRRPVVVVPVVSVSSRPSAVLLPAGNGGSSLAAITCPHQGGCREVGREPAGTATVRVHLVSQAPNGITGTLRVAVPPGWRAEPASQPVRFAAQGEVHDIEVTLHPAIRDLGEADVRVEFAADGGERISGGVEIIDYPHIRARLLPRDAAVRVRAASVLVPGSLRIAYVEGAGEPGPSILSQIGVHPTLLGAEDLASGDLSRFDVVVVGSRAYEVRADLRQHNARLLEWVRGGGHMIVLYNKYELADGHFMPLPFTMTRPIGRVTDENAAVRILEPQNRLFTTPNRIVEIDWAGWVQERGLYFAETWDPAYSAPLEMADPGEAPQRGSLLVARYGQGTYIYTGLAFFRELPAGVPGAWRLFANLLAYGTR